MYEGEDQARGERLATLRRGSMMSQAALATAAGVHVATVKRAEAGRPMSPETAQALCSVLRVGAADLAAPPARADAPAPSPAAGLSMAIPKTTGHGRARGRRRLVAFACACAALGCWLQVRAWEPPGDGMDLFREWQAASQTALAAALLALACAMRSGRRPWPARARKAGLVTAAILALAWPTVALGLASFATVDDLVAGTREFSKLNRIVQVRQAMDPAWDASRAHWVVMRRFQHLMAHETPWAETPGALAWHEARRRECEDLFLHAERYPRETCDPAGRVIAPRDADQLLKSLTGGSLVTPVDGDPSADEILERDGFAPARAIVEAHGTDVSGAMREAKAYAVARRDRQGPGG